MITIGMFGFGALGALLFVYLAKNEPIPEFRPLFDTFELQREARRHRKHIEKTERDIDTVQDRLRNVSADGAVSCIDPQCLTTVLESYLEEIDKERTRLQYLEHQIRLNQMTSRTLGFFFYIIMGGIIGALLATEIEINVFASDSSNYIESMVIGATWISYLSTIGFRFTRNKPGERIDRLRKDSLDDMKIPRDEIINGLREEQVSEEVLTRIVQKVDHTNLRLQQKLQDDFDITREIIDEDAKGML